MRARNETYYMVRDLWLGANKKLTVLHQMSIENLKGVIPKSVMEELPSVMTKFKINTVLRLAHFLSQCHHESAGFTAIRENLNYSKDGLLKTFPKYFTPHEANLYAHDKIAIGSRVYANRMGNGNEASHEGHKFSGKGYLQLTGKSNYECLDAFVDDDVVVSPDLVATKYPLLSAAWFFDANGLLSIADQGGRVETITVITKRINGGTNGLNERIALFNEYYKLLKQA